MSKTQIPMWTVMDKFYAELKVGDHVRAGGAYGIIMRQSDDWCWVLLNNRTECEPFEREQIEPSDGWDSLLDADTTREI